MLDLNIVDIKAMNIRHLYNKEVLIITYKNSLKARYRVIGVMSCLKSQSIRYIRLKKGVNTRHLNNVPVYLITYKNTLCTINPSMIKMTPCPLSRPLPYTNLPNSLFKEILIYKMV